MASSNSTSPQQPNTPASGPSSYSSTSSGSTNPTSTSSTTLGSHNWTGSLVTAAERAIIQSEAQQLLNIHSRGNVITLNRKPAHVNQTLPGLKCEFVWMEDGCQNRGLQHITKHLSEFSAYRIGVTDIPELYEAALSVGLFAGHKSSVNHPNSQNCPVFVLRYYGHPIIVAVPIADDGFNISMFPIKVSKVQKIASSAGISLSGVNDILFDLLKLGL